MAVMLDANAAMAIVKEEEEGLAIKSHIQTGEDVFAPDLFKLEVASALWKYVRGGYMEQRVAQKYYHAANSLVTRFVRQNDLMPEVLHEAARLNHPVYDIVYLVLARRLGATLASLDRRLIDLCEREGIDCIEPIALSN